jgi:hypothetical protein
VAIAFLVASRVPAWIGQTLGLVSIRTVALTYLNRVLPVP